MAGHGPQVPALRRKDKQAEAVPVALQNRATGLKDSYLPEAARESLVSVLCILFSDKVGAIVRRSGCRQTKTIV